MKAKHDIWKLHMTNGSLNYELEKKGIIAMGRRERKKI